MKINLSHINYRHNEDLPKYSCDEDSTYEPSLPFAARQKSL